MEEKQFTVDEHYLSQVYLRGFVPGYTPGETYDKKKKYFIWRYDVVSGEQIEVSTKSQCSVDNLYELFGKNGEYLLRNHLEKAFGDIEKKFASQRLKLEKKAYYKDNTKTKCFLDKDEKDFWVLFIVLQILRHPDTIDSAAKLAKEIIDRSLSDQQARNFALSHCAPFVYEADENNKTTQLLIDMAAPMRGMDFTVLYDEEGRFITAEKSVYVEAKAHPEKTLDYKLVVFPITSFLCLALTKNAGERYKNQPVLANEMCRDDVLYWFSRTNMIVYSNHELTNKEIAIIHGDNSLV